MDLYQVRTVLVTCRDGLHVPVVVKSKGKMVISKLVRPSNGIQTNDVKNSLTEASLLNSMHVISLTAPFITKHYEGPSFTDFISR